MKGVDHLCVWMAELELDGRWLQSGSGVSDDTPGFRLECAFRRVPFGFVCSTLYGISGPESTKHRSLLCFIMALWQIIHAFI